MAVNTREAVGWALLSNLLVHSSFISICTDCMWYSVSNILRRSIYLQDNIFRSSFEGLVPFSLSLCLYFLHTGHFPIWNTRHLRSPVNQEHGDGCMCMYHVVKKLRSWNHGVNQVDNFLNSQVLELIVAQTDGELLSAFGHHGLNQLAERCWKSNYLLIDWWFCQKTNTLFLLASNFVPRVRGALPELVKLFWDIFFKKYFNIDKK